MVGRCIVVVAGVLAAWSQAMAGELKPEEAKKFVAGKYFSYSCFEGTSGSGRINADGSVVGTIQIRGNGPVRRPDRVGVGSDSADPDSDAGAARYRRSCTPSTRAASGAR